ncbi:MAG: RNA polymerase sigma factor [Leptospirales bacterium]|nr:RNA polymerase sigma factor [Leptospirales bacterium]
MDSEKEFERIFKETSRMIYGLGQRLFRNEEDALDFVQDVYLEAYSKRDRFQGRSRYSTYLYSFALHRGLNRIRKTKRVQFEEWKEEDFPQVESELTPPGNVAPHILREELNLLPEVYRLPLVLHYYEKMSCAQIGASLSMNENTVKSYLHRGRKILKTKIEARQNETE